ncbi:hypothetical protein FHL15_000686 [Xylaria flabelliformis]|uniref:Uncharacterized protein n=1 Tax=Xylaria flabelliformis TaxID=2512241 RepID=A0A553IEH0_9PEZI|nr:hypothetical protein FHL15_000686 [Xylaria flabelliformis]
MDHSYVPPFRRHQAVGDSGDASQAQGAPNNHSNQSIRHNGNRQGLRGYGRGGRGGYKRDFVQKQRSQVDQSDLYHLRDIQTYFWGSVDDSRDSRSSTFHDSKDRPEQLSHLLLFFGANPRWANDHIVFAKSKLALLPEYAAKKADNGEWGTENKTHGSASVATDRLAPRDQDATITHNAYRTETVVQADRSKPAETQGLSPPAAKKQNSLSDEPSDGKGATSNLSTDSAGRDGPHDTPISAPSPTVTTTRMKYTDIRKETEASPASNQSTASESYMKYTDIRTIPAKDFYNKHEHGPPEPVLPVIAPIDYVPESPLPIAIFEEQRTPGLRTGDNNIQFAFKGWFKISRINILAPHSAELVRMLQQKWGRKDRFGHILPSKPRDASAWSASLAMEWAVVAFQLLEGEDAPPAPHIEKLPEPERPITKSVNEILSDMRLNDDSGGAEKDEHYEIGS